MFLGIARNQSQTNNIRDNLLNLAKNSKIKEFSIKFFRNGAVDPEFKQ